MRVRTDADVAARDLLPALERLGWQVVPPTGLGDGYSGTIWLAHADDPTHRSLDLLAQRWRRTEQAPAGQ